MKPSLLQQMSQRTLNLSTLIENNKDEGAEAVMSGLILFERRLAQALEQIGKQMQSGEGPASISAAITSCLPHAARYGAEDLSAIAHNAIASLDKLDVADEPLQGEAITHVMAWHAMAGQTRAVVKLAFQMAILYGLAPNGAVLEFEDAQDPFDA